MKEEKKDERPIIIKKVKKVAAGHHGGAWKVAYADFVTAMMALFLVLWLVSQADTKLKEAIASYFRSPGVFDTMKGGILGGPTKVSKEPSQLSSKEEEQALYSTAQMLEQSFQRKPEFSKYKEQIKVQVTEEGLRIEILDKAGQVSFPSGSAEMTAEARAILQEIGNAICQLPNPLLIGGHTDHRPFTGNANYTNWELSTDRANAARRALEETCVDPSQIRRIVGYSDTDPLLPEDLYAAANRRISILALRINQVVKSDQPLTDSGVATPQKGTGKNEKATGPKDSPEKTEVPPAKSPTGKSEPEPVANDEKTRLREELKRQKERLTTEGSVSVGTADKPPAKASRNREAAPKKKGE